MFVSVRRILILLAFLTVLLSYVPAMLLAHPSYPVPQYSSHDTETAYEEGIKKLDNGDWQAAIATWGTALQKQQAEQSLELKMAVKYIETVTEYGDRQHYNDACNYYLNAFRQASWERESEALEDEFKRLIPLVPHEYQKEWKKAIKNSDPAIFDKVVLFWEMMDPITSTDINERLIEHWRRIAYARKNFTRAHNTVYNTDDRGLVYVRFGKPDLEEKNVALPPNQIMNPVTGGPLRVNGMTFRPMIPLILDTDLWKYNFSNRQEPSFYLFGSNAKGGGEFRLQVGIMHMIPSFGYSFTMAGMDRQGGALMIKYSMIGKLTGVTGYYDRIYNDLTNAIISRSANRNAGSAVYQAPDILHRFEYEEVEQSRRRDRESPGSTTDLVTGGNLIPVDYNYYRYLSDGNETEYLLVMNPKLKKLDKRLETKNLEKHPVKDLSMKSSLMTIDSNGHRHIYASHDLNLLQIMDTHGNMSYFFNPDSVGKAPITGIDVFGDVGKKMKHDSVDYEGIQPIFSTGPLQLPLPDPLKWDPGSIVISDPIIGYRQNVNEDKRIPFIPALDPTFWNGDEILVFFEVYDHSINNYSIDFSYEKFQNSILLKKPKPFNENANVTALFKREGEHDRKWFYLKLNGFDVGSYNLKMTVKDDKGTVEDTRTVNFKIAEAPNQ